MAALTFKISLKEVDPEISRTVLVSSDSSMYLMHHIIQGCMGWKNYHLYHFETPDLNIGDLRLLLDEGFDEMNLSPVEGKNVMVDDIFTEIGQSIKYIYDYGDNWEHTLTLIDINKEPQQFALPILISGANACPPEDCGGPHGYSELKNILKNPLHKEYPDNLVWAGVDFDPEKFDKKKAQKNLAKLNSLIAKYEKGFKK